MAAIGIYLIYHARATNADINNDGKVDVSDLSILASNYGLGGKTFSQGDLNGDGYVTILDISILAANWGRITISPPSSINTDCSTDVTDAMQAWLDSVPNNSVIELKPGACYRSENTLALINKTGIILNGNGATIKAITDGSGTSNRYKNDPDWPRNRYHLGIITSTSIQVNNLKIIGPNPSNVYLGNGNFDDTCYNQTLEAQHGIIVDSSSGVVIDGVTINNVYGDFVNFTGGSEATWSNGVTLKNSTLSKNGRQGLGLTGVKNLTVNNNTIDNVCRTALDLEPNSDTGGVTDAVFQNNTFGAVRFSFFSAGGRSANIHRITIQNNNVQRFSFSAETGPLALPFGRRSGFYVIGNTRGDPGINEDNMSFVEIDDIIVSGNHNFYQSPKTAKEGVTLNDTNQVKVYRNDFNNSPAPLGLVGTNTSVIECENKSNGVYLPTSLVPCPGGL
ncbi:MAG TPA: right-handed parallel beta-helix repeat-containing protein [Candidatus Saccharimonadales bacterium]|nr:right-handed parallel beta-helix repeat-containing protein [Candidatus Saccharimonadales bacterium]